MNARLSRHIDRRPAAILVALLTACSGGGTAPVDDPIPTDPPFAGTIFLDPDIITPDDRTAFTGVTYVGQGSRRMFDRRENAFVQRNAFLFEATFDDLDAVEVQVNPEFGTAEAAEVEARRWAEAAGRIPTALRANVRTMWIHAGVEPFGGGNRNLLVHTGQGEIYLADGILEETFVHEAAHTSLDATHANAPGWQAAQRADPTFISTYARDFPDREDIAESVLPWLAVRHRADRIGADLRATIEATIPARLSYFDGIGMALHPVN